MTNDVDVSGLNDLVRVSRALKAAGDPGKGLRKELYAGLNRATKPVRKDLADQVETMLPSGGGLANLVRKGSRFGVSTRTGAQTVGVRLVARGKRRRTLASAEKTGSFRHPVFADASKPRKSWRWVAQQAGVRSGLLERKFESDKPEAKREVLAAIENVRNKIYRST